MASSGDISENELKAFVAVEETIMSMMGYLRPGLSSVYHWTDGNESYHRQQSMPEVTALQLTAGSPR
jgi:hypothetical protein